MFDCQDVLCVFGLSPVESFRYARRYAATWGARVVPVPIGRGERVDIEFLRCLADAGDRVVCVLPPHALVTEVIGALSGLDLNLVGMVGVLGRDDLDLANAEQSFTRVHEGGGEFEVPAAVCLTSLIEYATRLELVGTWENAASNFVAALASGEIRYWDRGQVRASRDEVDIHVVPGWLQGQAQIPEGLAERAGEVTIYRYVSYRPFHPTRLLTLLEEGEPWGSFQRVAGFVRLASRPGLVSMWDQMGETMSLDRFETDWWADEVEGVDRGDEGGIGESVYGSDLVAIGTFDPDQMRSDLDSCVLSDEEFAVGPAVWADMEDVFP